MQHHTSGETPGLTSGGFSFHPHYPTSRPTRNPLYYPTSTNQRASSSKPLIYPNFCNLRIPGFSSHIGDPQGGISPSAGPDPPPESERNEARATLSPSDDGGVPLSCLGLRPCVNYWRHANGRRGRAPPPVGVCQGWGRGWTWGRGHRWGWVVCCALGGCHARGGAWCVPARVGGGCVGCGGCGRRTGRRWRVAVVGAEKPPAAVTGGCG